MDFHTLAQFDLPAPVTACPTFIVTDTHLGDGGASDDSMLYAALLRAFIREIHQPGTLIITGGDLVDLWKAPAADILAAHSWVLREIDEFRIAGVRGNHDPTWSTLDDGSLLPEVYSAGGLTIMHGHQADPFNYGVLAKVGQDATAIYGELERLGWVTPGQMDDAAFAVVAPNYLAWAKRELDASRGVLFAFGHTHRPFAVQLDDGRVILNGGSFVPPSKPTVPPHKPTVGRVDGKRVELLEVSN